MVRRGTRGIADVMAHLKKMILDKCTNDSVMEYISVSKIKTMHYLKINSNYISSLLTVLRILTSFDNSQL